MCFVAVGDTARSMSVEFSTLKIAGTAAYMSAFGEVLTLFVIGMAACSLLYALCLVCERQLARRVSV